MATAQATASARTHRLPLTTPPMRSTTRLSSRLFAMSPTLSAAAAAAAAAGGSSGASGGMCVRSSHCVASALQLTRVEKLSCTLTARHRAHLISHGMTCCLFDCRLCWHPVWYAVEHGRPPTGGDQRRLSDSTVETGRGGATEVLSRDSTATRSSRGAAALHGCRGVHVLNSGLVTMNLHESQSQLSWSATGPSPS